MTPLLDLIDIKKDFRTGIWTRRQTKRVLHGVDLTLHEGETLALVGESGCGKSTLARCAIRLLEPTEGSLLFDGVELRALSRRELRRRRREFQMVFQDAGAALDPNMSVLESLLEPFAIHRVGTWSERLSRAHRLLELAGLSDTLANRRSTSLSGGQQQRLVIARALALEPRLLIADEPVSALDASVQSQICNVLLKSRPSLTMMLVSHSLPVAYHLATRVAVMYLGRIVEEASAERFFSSPRHPYSRALLRIAREGTSPFRSEAPSMENPPAGCPFHPRCSEVHDRCRTERPELLEDSQGAGKVACFLHS